MAFVETCLRGLLWSRLRLIERGGGLGVGRGLGGAECMAWEGWGRRRATASGSWRDVNWAQEGGAWMAGGGGGVVWGSGVVLVADLVGRVVCGSALASRRRNAPGRSTGVGGPGRSLLTRRRSRELP